MTAAPNKSVDAATGVAAENTNIPLSSSSSSSPVSNTVNDRDEGKNDSTTAIEHDSHDYREKNSSDGTAVIPKQQQTAVVPATTTKEDDLPSGQEEAKDAIEDDENELPFSKARCIALVATVTGAAFLNTLAIQSAVIVLPTIGRALNIPESRQQWIVSSYSLSFGCFLLFWGRVADLYGKRLIFILGSLWVTAVAAAQPFIPNEIGFDVFRGLHGLGAAANVPTAIGILGVTFKPGKAKVYAFSAYASGAPLGSVFGNILSGLIAEYSNWKWVFGALAIIAGVIAVAGILVIPPTPPPTSSQVLAASKNGAKSIDWIGSSLITIGLLALLFALTEGNVVGWSTPWIPVIIVVSVLVIAVFVFWQLFLERRIATAKAELALEELASTAGTQGHNGVIAAQVRIASLTPPLIKVSLFRNLRFSAVMLVMGFFFAGFNNYFIFATFYFQEFQGRSPLQTMLRFIPTGVGGATIVFIVARLLSRVPTVFILLTGNLAMAIANLLYAVPIPPTTSYFAWGLPAMLLAVVGSDTIWPCLTLFTSQALPPEEQAIGGALINAMSQLGRSIGLAIGTAVQTAVMANARGLTVQNAGGIIPWEPESLKGLRAASWFSFALALAAVAIVPVAFRTLEIVGKTPPRPTSTAQSTQGVVVDDTAPSGRHSEGDASNRV